MMSRYSIIAAAAYALNISQFTLNAQSTAFFDRHEGGPSSAVDAKGVRHYGRDYPGRFNPWTLDCVGTIAPYYPYDDRWRRHQGTGLFRLSLDLKTGAVANVTLLKSTGFWTLDNSAIAALRKWRWQPGKWREVEVNVTFQITTSSPPADAIRIPNS